MKKVTKLFTKDKQRAKRCDGKKDLLNMKHKAFSCIFELLQVIAVSNKYLQLLEKEEKGIANENKEDIF